ncbi:Hypothetical predicted protein [Octopus vulgaris]|uniref:Trafficking protein particle complex subunit 11 n=1 Tax=Octopus vulgaris TaxID=6645 RepID=A0AA36BJE1_OCTVU|nr:Hypothetical predicted protein [Octopus vulgaris]
MSWAAELPEELLCRPTGLVVLTGLDVVYNAIHKAVWDAFVNNRRHDRVSLKFKVFEGDHEYPKCRSKQRTSYEWYIPKGILKRSWMNKHLSHVPAVVVIFFDLDWDEPMWKEKQMECATRVEIVRNSLLGRGTKVDVVLIQKNAPLLPGEDVIATERAAALCTACELSMKSLFVLHHTDHLVGYVIRLENAFYEQSQNYYHNEARKVKAHKDFLNKITHQLLFVRHQFKIAFFNELKQDSHTALKHYKQAYGQIQELRMHETNLLEIKTIAGFVNYKICRLSFQHNAPLDAIAQFRRHIDFFKNRIGVSDLSFEHNAWMSKQFQVFGDLFDEAIKLGLTAIQTQHPGFYYQHAANLSIARKSLCGQLCKPVTSQLNWNPLENLGNLDFYGQRPWRQGHQSIDPPDIEKEKEGIMALQNMERDVDHSWIIIPQLSSAVAQFKKYKSPRMKRHLMVQMGEEYFHAKDYNKALMMLNKVMWDYRVERWRPPLTHLLQTSLKCAYLTAKVHDYITVCLELTGEHICCSVEEKTRILMNFIRVMSNDSPEPEPGLEPGCVEKARNLWTCSDVATGMFRVEMQNIVPFVECKGRFTSDSFSADSEVKLEIYLRVSCPFPVRFARLSVLLSNQVYNQYCVVNDGHGITAASECEGENGDLYLVPNKTRIYRFSFLPMKEDVGNQLEITTIVLQIGTEGRLAFLYWLGAGGDAVAPSSTAQTVWHKKESDGVIDWKSVTAIPITKIIPRHARLDIKVIHDSPSLLNEFYLVKINITNKENASISDISLTVEVQDASETTSEQTTHICVQPKYEGETVSKIAGIELGKLDLEEEITQNLYVKCMEVSLKTINFKVSYTVNIEFGQQKFDCTCYKEDTFNLNTVMPFEVSTKISSLKFEHIESVYSGEHFLVIQELHCTSTWPVEIETSELLLKPIIKHEDEEYESQLKNVVIARNECATECICLQIAVKTPSTVPLGSYKLHWRRKTENDDGMLSPYVSTVFPLPTLNIECIPISVGLHLPAFGSVKTLLPLIYEIHNKTSLMQELEAVMEPSDSFMFSGNKQIHFRIPPIGQYQLTYNLFPLIPGHVSLPKLHLNLSQGGGGTAAGDSMDEVLQKLIPSHIFIKPTGKALNVSG